MQYGRTQEKMLFDTYDKRHKKGRKLSTSSRKLLSSSSMIMITAMILMSAFVMDIVDYEFAVLLIATPVSVAITWIVVYLKNC